MGKLEVRGEASRTVDYDIMKIRLDFNAKENTAKEASEKVMKECEEFLTVLKKGGADISGITLSDDSVSQYDDYIHDSMVEKFKARRALKIDSKFNTKLINDIRTIINSRDWQVTFHVDFELSNEEEIREELYIEALKGAKKQAQAMAEAIDQKVISLISADKNSPKPDSVFLGEVLCMGQLELSSGDCVIEHYDNSDELSADKKTYTETIYTTWEIA